ncbi:DEAD/DEAH box helicase family protein [Streptomyces nodosus]|uniref:DEAD/DEAH box helicase family protein n=1 Tax=Streptomyces nodosus TaxID=40318 RepID=UPI003455B9C0
MAATDDSDGPSPWADAWEEAHRRATGSDAVLLQGHVVRLSGTISDLDMRRGRASALAAPRHGEPCRAVIRVAQVSTAEHDTVAAALSDDHRSAVLAGGLPPALLLSETTGRVALAPAPEHLSFTCDCGRAPCQHTAALGQTLAERFQDRPSHWLTLRGLHLKRLKVQDSPPTPAPAGVKAGQPARLQRSSEASSAKTFVLLNDAPNGYGVRRNSRFGVKTFHGRRLPGPLASFKAPRHSWERLVEDILSGRPLLTPPGERHRAPLYEHQRPRVEQIHVARAKKAPGFLLVSPTGSGKTAMLVGAVRDLPSVRNVLVITKHQAVPQMRLAVDYFGAVGQRWVVTNAEHLWKLFEHPWHDLASLSPDAAADIAASSDETRSRVPWDVIAVDESQILANPHSVRSRLVQRLRHPKHGPRPYCLRLSATPFSVLEETWYCADLIAHAAGVDEPTCLTGAGYLDWLDGLGLGLDGSRGVEKVKELLFRCGVGSTATPADLGLPEQERKLHPLTLSQQDRQSYQSSWEEFQRIYDLRHGGDEPVEDAEFAAALRRVQKASVVKAPYVARMAADLVSQGHQVIVPAWYLDTVGVLARYIARELRMRGLPDRVLEITGENLGLRELKRRSFQTGRAQVVVLNIVDAMNLHAGEANADGKGTRATLTPRVTVFADILTGGKRFLQAEGRGQRDGQIALAYYAYAAGTTEEAWLARALLAAAGTQELVDHPGDAAALVALAEHLAAEDSDADGQVSAR